MTNGELAQLIEEPPHGHNAGRRASDNPDADGARHLPLGTEDAQARDFMREGGWTIVTVKDGARAGISAHRGAVHADEHVDENVVRAAVVARLGFTFDEVHAVYRQGRLSDQQRELRGRIDARLLALSRVGVQVHQLGKVLGLRMRASATGGERCEAVSNALARAKQEEAR